MMVARAPWRHNSAAQASDAGPPPMQATRRGREAARSRGQILARGVEGVDRVPLQQCNLDGLAVVAMHHAGAFAQHIDGAGTRATAAQNVGIENAQRGAAQVAGGDALDESGNVDVRGTGGRAGRVETIEAAVGLNRRGLGRKRPA